MPLRSAKYFMQNKDELTEVDTICTAWKASQRPPLSWPAVVVNNCNNVDTAKTLLLNKNETDKLRRERSEEHTSELQSLMRISYAVFCLKKKTKYTYNDPITNTPDTHYPHKPTPKAASQLT